MPTLDVEALAGLYKKASKAKDELLRDVIVKTMAEVAAVESAQARLSAEAMSIEAGTVRADFLKLAGEIASKDASVTDAVKAAVHEAAGQEAIHLEAAAFEAVQSEHGALEAALATAEAMHAFVAEALK